MDAKKLPILLSKFEFYVSPYLSNDMFLVLLQVDNHIVAILKGSYCNEN